MKSMFKQAHRCAFAALVAAFVAPCASASTIIDTINGNTFFQSSGYRVTNVTSPTSYFQSIALPFTSASATTITTIDAYIGTTDAVPTGSVDLGIMADSGGLPSATFIYDSVVSLALTSPVSLNSLSWSIAGGLQYWLVAIAVDGTDAGWNMNNINLPTSALASGHGDASSISWGVIDWYLPEARITDDAVSAVPLPAALPLFATGLGALGLLGWRNKRKAKLAA
jgi:hypothetical protein